MEKKEMWKFENFVGLAVKFVQSQQGVRDYHDWLDFLLHVQKKSIDVTDEMKQRCGQVLEPMKKIYLDASGTRKIENTMIELSDSTIKFFKKTGGICNPSEWEKLLNNVQKKGIALTEEIQAYLMELLINMKEFHYFLSPHKEDIAHAEEMVEEIVEDLTRNVMIPYGLKELRGEQSHVTRE
jgi:hypothetical protein